MKRMKLFLPLLIFMALAGLLFKGLWLDPNAMPSALIDKPMPEFKLPSLQQPGKLVGREDIVGEVALLNVWATWCPSCRVEHPYLMELAEKEQIPIIGVDYKDERTAALKWLEKLGDPYVINIFDEKGRLGIDLGVFGAPETYLLDQQGVIRYRHIGVVDETVWLTKFKPLVDQLKTEQLAAGMQRQ